MIFRLFLFPCPPFSLSLPIPFRFDVRQKQFLLLTFFGNRMKVNAPHRGFLFLNSQKLYKPHPSYNHDFFFFFNTQQGRNQKFKKILKVTYQTAGRASVPLRCYNQKKKNINQDAERNNIAPKNHFTKAENRKLCFRLSVFLKSTKGKHTLRNTIF